MPRDRNYNMDENIETELLSEKIEDSAEEKPIIFWEKWGIKTVFLGGLVILFLILIFSITDKKSIVPEPIKTAIPIPTIAPTMKKEEFVVVFESKSLDLMYNLKLYGPAEYFESGVVCNLVIEDEANKPIDINWMDRNEINCSEDMGNFSSDFLSWHEKSKLLFKGDLGEMVVFDLENKTIRNIKYDVKQMVFWGASRDLKYWFFTQHGKEIPENDFSFAVTNDQMQTVNKGILPTSYDGYDTVAYDYVNNGFVIVTEQLDEGFTKDAKSRGEPVNNGYFRTRFYFLDLNSMSVRNLLTSDPEMLAGRGCYKEVFEFKPGEIIIKSNTAGCILLAGKYWDKNGELRFRL